jgi:hypothetical protein
MTSQQLVRIQHIQYEPIFDPEINAFSDKSPWSDYQRNRHTYTCQCKSGTIFGDKTTFSSHIKSQCHKKWLIRYNDTQEITTKMEKHFQIRLKQLEQQNVRLIAEREKWRLQALSVQTVADDIANRLEIADKVTEQTQESLSTMRREKSHIEEELNNLKNRIKIIID